MLSIDALKVYMVCYNAKKMTVARLKGITQKRISSKYNKTKDTGLYCPRNIRYEYLTLVKTFWEGSGIMHIRNQVKEVLLE